MLNNIGPSINPRGTLSQTKWVHQSPIGHWYCRPQPSEPDSSASFQSTSLPACLICASSLHLWGRTKTSFKILLKLRQTTLTALPSSTRQVIVGGCQVGQTWFRLHKFMLTTCKCILSFMCLQMGCRIICSTTSLGPDHPVVHWIILPGFYEGRSDVCFPPDLSVLPLDNQEWPHNDISQLPQHLGMLKNRQISPVTSLIYFFFQFSLGKSWFLLKICSFTRRATSESDKSGGVCQGHYHCQLLFVHFQLADLVQVNICFLWQRRMACSLENERKRVGIKQYTT